MASKVEIRMHPKDKNDLYMVEVYRDGKRLDSWYGRSPREAQSLANHFRRTYNKPRKAS